MLLVYMNRLLNMFLYHTQAPNIAKSGTKRFKRPLLLCGLSLAQLSPSRLCKNIIFHKFFCVLWFVIPVQNILSILLKVGFSTKKLTKYILLFSSSLLLFLVKMSDVYAFPEALIQSYALPFLTQIFDNCQDQVSGSYIFN